MRSNVSEPLIIPEHLHLNQRLQNPQEPFNIMARFTLVAINLIPILVNSATARYEYISNHCPFNVNAQRIYEQGWGSDPAINVPQGSVLVATFPEDSNGARAICVTSDGAQAMFEFSVSRK